MAEPAPEKQSAKYVSRFHPKSYVVANMPPWSVETPLHKVERLLERKGSEARHCAVFNGRHWPNFGSLKAKEFFEKVPKWIEKEVTAIKEKERQILSELDQQPGSLASEHRNFHYI